MGFPAYLNHILKSRKLGFAIFSQDLVWKDHNFQYSHYLNPKEIKRPDTNLWELMPELIGIEETIKEILLGRKRDYKIEKINKIDKTGKQKYYDLTFTIIKERNTSTNLLFCLIDDVTEQASIEQDIRQKKYEIQLLKSQLLNQASFLTDSLLGQSPQVEEVREFVNKVAGHNTSVLLQGESGTGKSLVARLIHQASLNPNAPFIEINCAAIPATLLESEFFGYEKGAFTNAIASKKGLFEEADGGTLFLDEIGAMPLSLQAKLLTFLEKKTFRRLGSIKEYSVKIRLVAATNKNLKSALQNNEFRQDLFFRINVASTFLPPLRILSDDIIILANHFISLLSFEMKKNINELSDDAIRRLKQYAWPGNVRELRNVIERTMIFADGPVINAEDLVLSNEFDLAQNASDEKLFIIPDEGLSLEAVEERLLIESLKKTSGNQSRSAALLGLSLDTFRYRIKKLNIVAKNFR